MIKKKCILEIFILFALSTIFCLNLPAQEKRLGRHTVSEWRAIIDSTWGPGLPTATKLAIFDVLWEKIDLEYAGFPYLDVNWDSLKTLYRPEVEAGVSRGRFSAIMNKLAFSLQDMHAWFVDVALVSPNNIYFDGRPVFDYGPGTPLFWPSGWGPCGVFGAALTPLPDSSLLIYKAISAHPLGLVPGDIVLGYEGIPWKQLYTDVLAVEFPRGWGMFGGTTPRGLTHSFLTSAGINWGLFDTVDIVKYASGDTVHLPTGRLAGLAWGTLWSSEQLPVPGISMPDWAANQWLTYGVIDGTSIGYVYCAQWSIAQVNPFRTALNDLLKVKGVTGLILDCRFNVGGDTDLGTDWGFDLLFNENPAGASRWRHAMRIKGDDHFAFSRSSPFDASVVMQPDYFDRPIAVLTGPATSSMADMHSFRLRFHPMVRFFGLPTNGAFCVPEKFGNNVFPSVRNPLAGTWYYMFPLGQMESLVDIEGLLMHKGFPVDEEVWLTRDGVARGEDDVVKRAVDWITTVSHSHSLQLAQVCRDSIYVSTHMENPLSHSLGVTVTLRNDQGTVLDSLTLTDGGAPGDSLWGASYAPASEGRIHTSIRTDDLTVGTSRTFADAGHVVFTQGPIIALDTRTWNLGAIDRSLPAYDTTFFVKNIGYAKDSVTVTVTEDPSLLISPTVFALAPGDSQGVTFTILPSLLLPDRYDAQVFVKSWLSYSKPNFSKSMRFDISDGVEEERPLPTSFSLEQNYPNPFNPTTVVRSQTPEVSNVKLTIYDVLGRELKVLVNERRAAGYYEDTFDASGLASGVYIYRLTAGAFVQSRKMLLLK